MVELTEPISDTLGIYISISEAAKLSGVSEKIHLNAARDGFLPYRNGSIPDVFDSDEQIARLSEAIEIPLSEMDGESIKTYLLENITKSPSLSIDFKAFQHRYGDKALSGLLSDIQIIKEIQTLRENTFSDKPSELVERICQKYGLTSKSYYRQRAKLREYSGGEIAKLIGAEKPREWRLLCPLSRDFIKERVYCGNMSDVSTIYLDLVKEAEVKGKDICNHCPHNPDAPEYQEALNKIETDFPTFRLEVCDHSGNGMIHPEDEKTVRRFKNSLPESTIYFSQHEDKNWDAKYGNKVSRKYPAFKNELAMSDHTCIPVLVIVGKDKDGEDIITRPWATIQTDVASDMITSSVISVRPNHFTIGYCFATACAVTKDSIACGVPHTLLTDRGRDYLSHYIRGDDEELWKRSVEDTFVNRAFFENGLLPVLNCTVRQTRYPWGKSIERVNREVKRLLKRFPGYIGNWKQRRKNTILKEDIKRLKDSGRIMTIEQFARFWYGYVVPTYNNHSFRGALSPIEKYRSLPEVATVVPEWNTLSVFLREKRQYRVFTQGIVVNGITYNSPKLDEFRGTNKKVWAYKLGGFYDRSVFVLYSDKTNKDCRFICEAFPVDKIDFDELNKLKLQRNTLHKIRQKQRISDEIQCVDYLTKSARSTMRHYLDEDEEIMGKIFGPVPSEADDRMEIVSKAAFDAFEAEYLATKRLMKELEADQREDLQLRLVKALKSH